MKKDFLHNLRGHWRTIMLHKREVSRAMTQCGRPIQGFFHDMSKFSPVEFWESVKYFQGTRSPIEACKEDLGYSRAWFHHRGVNPHHSQYWVDLSFGEIKPCEMPWKYLLEFICDGVGAGRAYNKEKWTDAALLDYWNKKDHKSIYHPNTRKKIEFYYAQIALIGWDNVAAAIRQFGDYYKDSPIFEQRLDAFNELRKLPDCSQCPGLGWLISHQINESLPRYEIVPWEPDDTFTLDEMDGDV